MADSSLMHARSRANHNSFPKKFTQWLFSSISSWRSLMGGLIAVGLTVVSIKFNLELAKSMSVDDDSKTLLMAGFALLDLSCVFLAGFIGIRSRSPFRKAVAWFLFAYLLALSLWAATAYALAIDSRKASTANNHAVELKKSELETQQKNVEIWQQNLAGTERFKTRYSALLADEQAKLRTIQSELSELEQDLPEPTMAIYERVSPHVDMEVESLALLVRILWSIALVISPLILLPLLGVELYGQQAVHDNPPTPPKGRSWKDKLTQLSKPKVTQTSKTVNKPQAPQHGLATATASKVKKPKAPKELAPDRADTGTGKNKSGRYNRVKQQVISGKVRPSKPAIKKAAECGQSTADRYLSAMAQEGIIVQKDNGQYRLNNVVPMKGRAAQ